MIIKKKCLKYIRKVWFGGESLSKNNLLDKNVEIIDDIDKDYQKDIYNNRREL